MALVSQPIAILGSVLMLGQYPILRCFALIENEQADGPVIGSAGDVCAPFIHSFIVDEWGGRVSLPGHCISELFE